MMYVDQRKCLWDVSTRSDNHVNYSNKCSFLEQLFQTGGEGSVSSAAASLGCWWRCYWRHWKGLFVCHSSVQQASQHDSLPCGSSVVFSAARPVVVFFAAAQWLREGSPAEFVSWPAEWWALAELAALLVRKEDAAVDRLASEALAVAGGVDSLQSCPLDVSEAVFRNVSVAVTDWC
jgi:hypothetical protein